MIEIFPPYPLLSPLIDLIFKVLFTRSGTSHLLLDITNTVVRPKEPFKAIQVLNPAIDLATVGHKAIVLDILAKTPSGDLAQIEMQTTRQPFYIQRALHYATRLASSQLAKGEGFQNVRAAYAIHFLNFDLLSCPNPDQFVQTFRLREDVHGTPLTDLFQLSFVELRKFQRLLMKNPHGSGDTHLDNWLQFLLNPSDKCMEIIVRSDPIIGEAMRHLSEISSDDVAREQARMREKAERDWATGMYDAHSKGLAEGRAEGEAKGRAEGEAKGEAKAKYDFLKSLLESPKTAALADTDIATLVGLPVEQVTAIRATLSK